MQFSSREIAQTEADDDRQEGSSAARTQPTHATGARAPYPAAHKEAPKKWDTILETTPEDGGLTLSHDGVEEFKKVALDPRTLRGIQVLTIAGSKANPYDLRDIPDLAERVGQFPDLELLDLRNTKIDVLNVGALPPSLHTVNLRGSVVPLPLQERLQEYFGKEAVLLSKRYKQIEKYEDNTLNPWVQDTNADSGADREGSATKTLDYLQGKTDPSSLDVSGHNVGKFDDDWHTMIASNELTDLDMSGNKLKRVDLAEIALSPNLQTVRLNDNEISRVRNADWLSQLESLQTLEMKNNRLRRLPDGIEYAPESSTINLEENEYLSSFSKIDAKLIKFAKQEREAFDASRRELRRGPTILTDSIVNDKASMSSRKHSSGILDVLEAKHESIRQVEQELDAFGADDASRARWREVGDTFEKHAYVEALEIVMIDQGGHFKFGRMQRFREATERAVEIAGNRASTLHPLEGQSNVPAGTRPGYQDYQRATKAAGIGAKMIPVPGAGIVGGAARIAAWGIDQASTRYFDEFHSNLLQMFRPSELKMLSRVLPLAMTMTMGEKLESDTVSAGKPRHTEPSQKVLDFFTWGARKETEPPKDVELRGFRDAAYLMDDIASGAAYGIPNNKNKEALLKKLQGMTFEQKVEEPLAYWANRNNCANEPLPFKKRYIIYDAPVDQRLAMIAKHYTLNDLQQGKEISGLKGELQGLEDRLNEETEKRLKETEKRHKEKRSRRKTTQALINSGFEGLELSDWESDPEKVADRAGKLLPSSAPAGRADLESGGDVPSLHTAASPLRQNPRSDIAQAPGGERDSTSRKHHHIATTQQGRGGR